MLFPFYFSLVLSSSWRNFRYFRESQIILFEWVPGCELKSIEQSSFFCQWRCCLDGKTMVRGVVGFVVPVVLVAEILLTLVCSQNNFRVTVL